MVALVPALVNAGSYGPQGELVVRARLEGLDRAEGVVERRAELDGRTVRLPSDGAAVADPGGVDGRWAVGWLEAVAVGWWVAGAVVGLNVATESIAPATRQTARMLASSGMTVPCPAKGDVSRRSRRRRRLARSSR